MIRLENVSFSYDMETDAKKMAINGLNLKVSKGDYIALMGNNGSGKTTLGRIIKGLLVPASGKTYYRGEDVSCKGLNNQVGYIFSNSEDQIISPIVEEDVAFGPENQGGDSSSILSAVSGALETVNLSALKKSLSHHLSGGEQQKVLISGIIAMKVDCIIFDEATAMLDSVDRRTVCRLLYRLNSEQGITIINITHNLDEILDSNRVIVMRAGRIVYDGSTAALLSDIDIIKTTGLVQTPFTTLVNRLITDGIISKASIGTAEHLSDQITKKQYDR